MTTQDLKRYDMTSVEKVKATVADQIIAAYLKNTVHEDDPVGTKTMHTVARATRSGNEYAFYDEKHPSKNLMFRPFQYHLIATIADILNLHHSQINVESDTDVQDMARLLSFQSRNARLMFKTSHGSSDLPDACIILFAEPDIQDKGSLERMGFSGYDRTTFIASL